MANKIAAISLREAARRAGVSYPTAIKKKKQGLLDDFVVPTLDGRIVYRPNVAKKLTRLRDEGYMQRGRPREILIDKDGV